MPGGCTSSSTVLNHTLDQHPWFLESASSRTNPKQDWYIWRDGRGQRPPNNWRNMLGQVGWHYVSARDKWYFASFLPFQPDFNYRNPEVKQTMLLIVRHWLHKGCGWLPAGHFQRHLQRWPIPQQPADMGPVPDGGKPGWRLSRESLHREPAGEHGLCCGAAGGDRRISRSAPLSAGRGVGRPPM